jgi:hypothetical protein
MSNTKIWSKRDNQSSLRQGWGIFATGSELRILKYDEDPKERFAYDEDALDYVLRNAKKGGLCRRAVLEVYGI